MGNRYASLGGGRAGRYFICHHRFWSEVRVGWHLRRCCGKMRGEDGGISCCEILGKALYGRILKKECRCQIKLIDLIETIGQCCEDDRIKTILGEVFLAIDLLNPDFEPVGNHM